MNLTEALKTFGHRAATISHHEQVAGKYMGETLIKLYSPGSPSLMLMLRPSLDGKSFTMVTFKQDASTLSVGS
jgi:hypothetical protein